MAHKGYTHPQGIPKVMQKEYQFPTFSAKPDPGGYIGNDYKKRKKVTARGHTWQSQKRMDRLKGREFMKKFKGRTRPILV